MAMVKEKSSSIGVGGSATVTQSRGTAGAGEASKENSDCAAFGTIFRRRER